MGEVGTLRIFLSMPCQLIIKTKLWGYKVWRDFCLFCLQSMSKPWINKNLT